MENQCATAAPMKPLSEMSKEAKRKAMPYTTKIVDAYREAFGVVGIRASERGYVIVWGEI